MPRTILFAFIAIACFLLGGLLLSPFRVTIETGRQAAEAAPAAPGRAVISADEPVARAAAAASPAVVNIDTVRRLRMDDWFFGSQIYEGGGIGSGFIIDRQGTVLTNDHVVAGASSITVTLATGTRLDARVIGTDDETDVGIVRLINPPPDLPISRLGDSRGLVPGQWAIAIGNPYGYQQTVTVGVIGNTGRAVEVEERLYKSLIQTDAAINPGNSGGPLIDIRGNVIGVNTVVRADAQGIGFAIPIHIAREVAAELAKNGKIRRPWVGMQVQDITADAAAYLGLARAGGVFVERLDRRGPAFAAGIRPGDVIRAVNDTSIRSRAAYEAAVARLRIGEKMKLTVERDGEQYRGELTLAEKP